MEQSHYPDRLEAENGIGLSNSLFRTRHVAAPRDSRCHSRKAGITFFTALVRSTQVVPQCSLAAHLSDCQRHKKSDFTVNTNRCHCPHTRLMVQSPGLPRDFQCCGQLRVYMHSSLDLSVLYPAAIESPILPSASVCHEDGDENFDNHVIKNFRNN